VVDPDRAGRGGHPPVGRDRQDVAQPVGGDRGPQGGVSAVDLVGGHPSGGYLRVNRALDQVLRERRFGRENPLPAGDSGGIIAPPGVRPSVGIRIGVDGPRGMDAEYVDVANWAPLPPPAQVF